MKRHIITNEGRVDGNYRGQMAVAADTTLAYGGIDTAEIPHTFTAPSKTSNISINKIITLNNGDYLEAWSKCDTGSVTLTIKSLAISCWGDR